MRNGRFVSGLAVALVLLSLLVSGCGSASPAAPSGLDPARMAPASTLLYVSVEVRPQGSQGAQVRQTLRKLYGASADSGIRKLADKFAASAQGHYDSDVKPWLGQRVGLVFTQFPNGTASHDAEAVIAPTHDPSAARAFITKLVKHNPGTEGRVVDGYAVYGGSAAYREIVATRPANSLASSAGYRTTVGELGSGDSALMYMNLRRFAEQVAGRMSSAGASGSELGHYLGRIGANAGLAAGLKLRPSAISLDVNSTGIRPGPHRTPADVGGLPAASWLALASSGFSGQSSKQLRAGLQLGMRGALSRAGASGGAVERLLNQRLAFVERDVLPALGPLSLAVGGTSPLNLEAGLKLAPSSQAAAARLLGRLRAQAARNPSLSLTGKNTDFSVRTPLGTHVRVRQAHHRVVATYGFGSQSAFLSPASKLSQDPAYQQALAQLPQGSSVPLYISFAPIAALVRLTDHQASAASTVRTLNKLNYLIVGGTTGRVRLVLALR